jgi:hypothetical protein
MATLPADEPCPLPEDPALADVAKALDTAGAWGFVIDSGWRMVYMTDDIRLSNGGLSERVPVPSRAPRPMRSATRSTRQHGSRRAPRAGAR